MIPPDDPHLGVAVGRLLGQWGRRWGLGLRRAALRGALGALGALGLLWASAFTYGCCYWLWGPAAALDKGVHWDWRTDCDPPGPELCSFPTANLSLLGPNRQRVLLWGQRYRLALELELPESGANRALGLFLVATQTYGEGGRPIASTRRSAMLHYRSRLLRSLEALALAPLFLGGLSEQKQLLEVELHEGYQEDPYNPTEGVVLQLQSRRLQFYGARLRVHPRFSGIRYLLYHFPLLSALLGLLGNFSFFLLLLLGGGLLRWGRGRPPPTLPHPAPPPTTQTPQQEEEGEGQGETTQAPPPTSGDTPQEVGPIGGAPQEEEEEEKEEQLVGERQEDQEGEGVAPLLPQSSTSTLRQRPLSLCSSS